MQRRPSRLPLSYCIELTSTCPFDCVFCTRKETRGSGRHMDFELFSSLMRQAGRPERVLLNSLGESMHYPRLADAVRVAAASGATTELISTLCSAPERTVRGVLEAGLDRLHVSVHTLDEARFSAIYRFRSAEAMRAAVERFLELRTQTGARTDLDFSFVAMERNLEDLAEVVEFAQRVGVPLVRVLALTQPAHRRALFPAELEGAWLTRSFRERLAAAIARCREQSPAVEIEAPPLGECGAVSALPRVYPLGLPPGAALAGCDESPWETTHVRANGDVVACGDDAMPALGNLVHETLDEIWHGERYRQLREDHTLGQHPVCNDCPIKVAYRPGPLARAVSGATDSAQLLRGWHAPEAGGARWSRGEAALALPVDAGGGRLRVHGLLPPGPDGQPSRLSVSADGQVLGEVTGTAGETSPVDAVFSLPPGPTVREVTLRTASVFEPRKQGSGSRDQRPLGFALVRAETEGPA